MVGGHCCCCCGLWVLVRCVIHFGLCRIHEGIVRVAAILRVLSREWGTKLWSGRRPTTFIPYSLAGRPMGQGNPRVHLLAIITRIMHQPTSTKVPLGSPRILRLHLFLAHVADLEASAGGYTECTATITWSDIRGMALYFCCCLLERNCPKSRDSSKATLYFDFKKHIIQ